MNLKITTLSLLLAGSIGLIGCDDNDSKHSSDIIQQAFETKYPGIAVHDWEYKNGYSVAEFVFNGHEAEAWFDAQGQWYMTETDYGRDLNQLPQNIQEAFRQCSYATWSIDDIDMFEYPTQQTAYVFDLEQGDRDYVLTIYADGSIENGQTQQPVTGNVPDGTLKAFSAMYPNVTDVEWESKTGGYYEATFYQDKSKVEAWFKDDEWVMTETGVAYVSLPDVIRSAFKNSNFANRQIDDINKVERKTAPTLYVFDLSNSDTDLEFTEDGILFENQHTGSEDTPSGSEDPKPENPYLPDENPQGGQSGSTIESAVQNLYEGARIIEIDREYNKIEVDIVHNQIGKKITFDTQLNWLYTQWDVWSRNLPEIIQGYIQSNYTNAWIDDAEYYETPNENYYEVDIERHGDRDIDLWFDADGNPVSNPFIK